MSIENAKNFIAKVKEDPDLRALYEAATDEDERGSVRKDAGFPSSIEDFVQACKELGQEELTDDDLDKVAGGGCGFHIGGGNCNTNFF